MLEYTKYENFDDYVRDELVERLKDRKDDIIDTYTCDLVSNLFEEEEVDGCLFIYTKNNIDFMKHFLEVILYLADQDQKEVSAMDLNISLLPLVAFERAAQNIVNYVGINSEKISKDDVNVLINTIESLNMKELDFIK